MNAATIIFIVGFILLFSLIPVGIVGAIVISIAAYFVSPWCIEQIQKTLDFFKGR